MSRRTFKNVVTEIEEEADANATMPPVQVSSGVGPLLPAQTTAPQPTSPQVDSPPRYDLRENRYGKGLPLPMPHKACVLLSEPSIPRPPQPRRPRPLPEATARGTKLQNPSRLRLPHRSRQADNAFPALQSGSSSRYLVPPTATRTLQALCRPAASKPIVSTGAPASPTLRRSPPLSTMGSTGFVHHEARGPSVKDEQAVEQRTKKRHRIIGLELPEYPPEVLNRLAKTGRFREEASREDGEEFLSAKSSPSTEYGSARSRFSDDEDSVDSPAHGIPVVTITISGSPPPSPTRQLRPFRPDTTTPLSSARCPRPPPAVATSPPSARGLNPPSFPSSPRTPTSDSATGGCESDSGSRKRARTTLRLPRRRPGTRAPLSSPPSPRTSASDSSTGGRESDSSSSKRRRTTLELPPDRQPDRRRRRRNPRVTPARASLERGRRYSSV